MRSNHGNRGNRGYARHVDTTGRPQKESSRGRSVLPLIDIERATRLLVCVSQIPGYLGYPVTGHLLNLESDEPHRLLPALPTVLRGSGPVEEVLCGGARRVPGSALRSAVLPELSAGCPVGLGFESRSPGDRRGVGRPLLGEVEIPTNPTKPVQPMDKRSWLAGCEGAPLGQRSSERESEDQPYLQGFSVSYQAITRRAWAGSGLETMPS